MAPIHQHRLLIILELFIYTIDIYNMLLTDKVLGRIQNKFYHQVSDTPTIFQHLHF